MTVTTEIWENSDGRRQHGFWDVLGQQGRGFLRNLMERVLEQLMDFGSPTGFRQGGTAVPEARQTLWNGYRERPLHAAGHARLQVPKLRQRSYFPSFWNRADSRNGH